MAEQARAAVAVTGAHHSSWNSLVKPLVQDDGQPGSVGWDNTIKYHAKLTVAVLQEMFDRAGQQHDEATLQRYREALRVVFHENIHLLAAAGTSLAMGCGAYQEPANEVLEEGTTELATQNALNQYIEVLDLETIAPGITAARTAPDYGAYTPAVKSFTDVLGDQTGLPGVEVIRRMAVVTTAHKLWVAAELLYGVALSAVVPDQGRAAAITDIAAAMKPRFAEIYGYDPLDVRLSRHAGWNAYYDGVKAAKAIEAYWSGLQDLRRSLDAGLGAMPRLDDPQGSTHDATRPSDPRRGKAGQSPWLREG